VNHILVATPCYGGLVHQRYMQSAIALLQSGPALGFRVTIEMPGYDSLVTRSRNALVAKFLDTEMATHLLFVDADIAFEVEQVVRMLRFDRDVVAGMYPLKMIDWGAEALGRAQRGEPPDSAPLRYVGLACEGEERELRNGFVTSLYAGTGFMLIKRAVFARLIAAFPETRYTTAHTQPVPSNSPNQYALFDCMIDPDTGHYLSEDYAFCRCWRSIGGRLWLDTIGELTTSAHTSSRGGRGCGSLLPTLRRLATVRLTAVGLQ
jgi:hypothetical protein